MVAPERDESRLHDVFDVVIRKQVARRVETERFVVVVERQAQAVVVILFLQDGYAFVRSRVEMGRDCLVCYLHDWSGYLGWG